MTGLMSLVSRSTVRLSAPSSSSRSNCSSKRSVASSSTRCDPSLFFRIDSIADGAPTITVSGVPSSSDSSSIAGRSVGSETTIARLPPSRRYGTKP